MTFGQPDEEGWYYGLTFDRLTEALKQKRATGLSSKMLVRSRRHVCVGSLFFMLLDMFTTCIIVRY